MPGNSDPLLLVPTRSEQEGLARALGVSVASFRSKSHLSGFGLVAAAARSAQLVAQLRPEHVVLVGIAGTLDPDVLSLGTATSFAQVASYGIGVGESHAYLTPEAIGFPQWDGDQELSALPPAMPLAKLPTHSTESRALLLSVAAASASAAESATKRSLFPTAAAEDMEGFGVAMACAMASIPCSIVRGISNVVGDREVERWEVTAALKAVAITLSEAGLA